MMVMVNRGECKGIFYNFRFCLQIKTSYREKTPVSPLLSVLTLDTSMTDMWEFPHTEQFSNSLLDTNWVSHSFTQF